MEPLLVTGATGLVGANVCQILAERSIPYRALVRPDSDAAPLSSLGADVVQGDVMAFDDVARAAQNCRAIIHSAAVLGGASQDLNVQERTNVTGAWNVYEAARVNGVRVVTLGTTTYFAHEQPLAEDAVMTRSSVMIRTLGRRLPHSSRGCAALRRARTSCSSFLEASTAHRPRSSARSGQRASIVWFEQHCRGAFTAT